ncbi:RMD1 family protein [Sediminicola luteus]|uniref:DUF155 domain-containing protein n=1 Tax=Sediminicola luteus TaxID=319238 RepID=A0A2A4G4V1_9FLAO|nr:RMD1 family protein [Sediminicola luteus]PCE62994.1 hypothetical protein B7P33_17105 [Sediminicola luteus]
MKAKIEAYQLADAIDIQGCKKHFSYYPLFEDRDELFLKCGIESYLYIFRYGTICTYNIDIGDTEEIKRSIYRFCDSPKFADGPLLETINVQTGSETMRTDFNSVYLVRHDEGKIRLIMMNTAQSVALDYFAGITERLLEDTRGHTSILESKGKLDIGGRTLKKYIGKVLNVKNRISENLYIFDSPGITWEDEALNRLNDLLKDKFDLKDRYLTINRQLDIVKENLDLFKDIMFHRDSSRLEWVIILLILFEVIDLIIIKLMG